MPLVRFRAIVPPLPGNHTMIPAQNGPLSYGNGPPLHLYGPKVSKRLPLAKSPPLAD